MKLIKKNFSGFTLVEMIVVISITLVLTGIGAVALNRFNNSQQLDGLKEEMMSDLKFARNLAITSQLPDEAENGNLNYVLVTINETNFDLDGVWTNGIGGVDTNSYLTKKNLATNTINAAFGFSVENGRLVNSDGNFYGGDICLTLYINDDFEKYIYVESNGLIYERSSCP